MPHKHKRKGGDPQHDLAPSSKHAAPLPVSRQTGRAKNQRRKGDATEDDAPRAFRRLLMRQEHLASGSKKRSQAHESAPPTLNKAPVKKTGTSNTTKAPSQPSAAPSSPPPGRSATEIRRILPHERLSDYGARIDASLPISGLQKRGSNPIKIGKKILKQPQTRTEKKMQRMQAEWRASAAKRKEREEAEADERELEELEREEYRVADELDGMGEAGGKKRRKRREDDPWAVLDSRRKVQRGLGDVVERPPDLKRLRGARLKMRSGQGVKA